MNFFLAPPAPPPMVGSGPPPPPPPPMPNFNSGGGNEPVSGLAAALQAAKLKKTPKSTENSGGSTTSSSGSSGYGSIGKGKEDRPPMVSMMDEMQKTLARRRAKVERVEDVSTDLFFTLQKLEVYAQLKCSRETLQNLKYFWKTRAPMFSPFMMFVGIFKNRQLWRK